MNPKTAFATVTLAALAAVRVATAQEAPAVKTSNWTIRGHVDSPAAVVVQAHRGAGDLAPENTIGAFELGWKLGCYAEADVRTTRDGVIVAFHDADFKRVVKNPPAELADKGVADVTFEQLSKLDVGAWKGDSFEGRHVSKMTDVFAAMRAHPERKLYLDIKNVDLAQLAAEVKEYGVGPQVILASTKYAEVIRKWKQIVPDSQTLYWMGGTEAQLEKRFTELRKMNFADVTQLQVHVKMKLPLESITRTTPDPFELSDAFLIRAGEEVRSHDILYQTLPWGGATEDVYFKLLDLGAMSFATDHPDVTRAAIEKYLAEGKGSK